MITSLTHPCNYEGIDDEEREQARRLAIYFKSYGIMEVLDVGCGPGTYVDEFLKVDIHAMGIDIDPRCKQNAHCEVVDVTKERADSFYKDIQMILSLEVGEHIPEEYSWKYVDYISQCNPGMVVFSAAKPGQGGDGHINCQEKSYWAHRFEKRGYAYDPVATDDIRKYMASGYHLGWFTQNVMIFYRF